MGNKLITDKGKTELLRIGFTNGASNGFTYLALGDGDSKAAQNGSSAWHELSGEGYQRVPTTLEQPLTDDSKQIAISGVFTEDNYHPSGDGQLITEIGLCNNETIDTDSDTFFLYSEVPSIYKNDNISLKYTIIISIE